MNFLGHLLLTYPHRDLSMGNLLGDLIRSREAQSLSPLVKEGIALHHEIDRHTDSHPGVRELIQLLRPVHAKYAPVVVDILMDYILARRWDTHASIRYQDFTDWVYALIPEYLHQFSAPVSTRLENMVRHRWIDDYDSILKLSEVLMRMDRRARFPSQFMAGLQDITQHYDLFSITFDEFYKDIRGKLVIASATHSSLR